MLIPDPKKLRFAAVMTNAVLLKMLLIVGCVYSGNWLDTELGTSPLFLLVLLFLGILAGTWWVLFTAKRYRS